MTGQRPEARRHYGSGGAGRFGWLVLVVVALCAGVGLPVNASEDHLFHEELGVDYQQLAEEVEATYQDAWTKTLLAARLLFPSADEPLVPDHADVAMALYEQAIDRVRETLASYERTYARVPLLFVRLDYLIVRSLGGMSLVFTMKDDAVAAAEAREALVARAEDARGRITFALERNILPQLHDGFLAVDAGLRTALSEAHVWIGTEAGADGNHEAAALHLKEALALRDDEAGQEAIRALIERVERSEAASVINPEHPATRGLEDRPVPDRESPASDDDSGPGSG
ncbi:MAG: hypothetical protein EA406_11505 [Rhodospirillales bacterium]|nr:MAG: hypothetical protein EA406_11505 [Rhodospirillales bacterium]